MDLHALAFASCAVEYVAVAVEGIDGQQYEKQMILYIIRPSSCAEVTGLCTIRSTRSRSDKGMTI